MENLTAIILKVCRRSCSIARGIFNIFLGGGDSIGVGDAARQRKKKNSRKQRDKDAADITPLLDPNGEL
jgi:hypothetical protein